MVFKSIPVEKVILIKSRVILARFRQIRWLKFAFFKCIWFLTISFLQIVLAPQQWVLEYLGENDKYMKTVQLLWVKLFENC